MNKTEAVSSSAQYGDHILIPEYDEEDVALCDLNAWREEGKSINIRDYRVF